MQFSNTGFLLSENEKILLTSEQQSSPFTDAPAVVGFDFKESSYEHVISDSFQLPVCYLLFYPKEGAFEIFILVLALRELL